MACEIFDELFPLVPIFRRGDVLFVPEGMDGVGIGGELFGHEAELDEGADFVFEEAVVDLVDVGEIVDGLAGLVFVVEAEFVVEDSVEADVVEAGDALGFAEVAAIAVAEGEDGAAGAEHFFPEVWEGMGGGVGVDFDDLRGGLRRGGGLRAYPRCRKNGEQQKSKGAGDTKMPGMEK